MTMHDIALPRCGSKDLLPDAVHDYLRHTAQGVPIRQLAREQGCHASTVQRRIRKVEGMRDDVLIDTALSNLSEGHSERSTKHKEAPTMNLPLRQKPSEDPKQEAYLREAKRILRRLCEPGAILAFAADMDKAVVVRETADGRTVKTAVTDREAVQSLAIRDWLVCVQPETTTGNNADAAKNRVMAALSELGPGLSDVAMRVCCFLEGVEAAEKRLGWSARSGKIVLRIALQRLEQHYKSQVGSDMIG